MAIDTIKFAVVVLGAGQSSRMGRPKLLLPWGPTTVLGHIVREWIRLGAEQVGVVATRESAFDDELAKLQARSIFQITNPEPDRGMFSSIRCAAQWPHWSNSITHWILALGDQPHLRSVTLQALLREAHEQPEVIWQPAYRGRPRHPVLLPKMAFEALRDTGASDLKEFLRSVPVERQNTEVDDPGLDLDIDTPEDYARARKLAGLD